MVQINKGDFEEIKELDEEQNYSSGFNSGRSGDKQFQEPTVSNMHEILASTEKNEIENNEENKTSNKNNYDYSDYNIKEEYKNEN